MTTDKIEKKILLRAPQSRVWKALTDSQQFGAWFGMQVDGPFVAGTKMRVAITPTKVNPEIAKKQEAYDGFPFDIIIERIEPERLFSFRWHPYAIDEGVDYSAEPTTLVEFKLEPAEGGVLLTVTESGFDQIPLARRAQAFKANEGGWEMQTKLVEAYLAQNP
ncbi:MAG TPA: SRPBCC family protein [Bryobacteraceae bacterium]|jgi:uncharacterized protein YndB with AHSA1/START domain|nr:SRPBCC family protein [Bryobacteraceae bacterium]